MKFLHLLIIIGIIFVKGNNKATLLQVLLENNLRDQLDIFPFELDKYQQNTKIIDSNQADVIRLLIQTTSLIIENHSYYILEKTTKTSYIEKMAVLIEKVSFCYFFYIYMNIFWIQVKLLLNKMRTILNVLTNNVDQKNPNEKVIY